VPDALQGLTLFPTPARAFLSHEVDLESAGLVYRPAQAGRELVQAPSPDVPLPVLEDLTPP